MSEPQRHDLDERLAEWVDGRMSPRDRDRFLAELRVNPQLKRALEQYERTVGVLRAALRAPTAPSRSPMADRVLAAVAAPAPVAAPRPAWFGPRLAWGCGIAAALLVAAVWLNEWSAVVPQRTTVATEDADTVLRLQDAAADPAAPLPAEVSATGGLPDREAAERVRTAEMEAPATAAAPVREQLAAQAPATGPADVVPKVPAPVAVPLPKSPTEAGDPALADGRTPTGATGPATGGPAGPAAGGRAVPAGPGSPGPAGPGGGGGGGVAPTTGSDDFYLGSTRRVAPGAPASGAPSPGEAAPSRSGAAPAAEAPEAKPGARDDDQVRARGAGEAKKMAVPMLAYVALEGVEGGATFGARGGAGPTGASRAAEPGAADSKAKSGEGGAGAVDKAAELAKEKAAADQAGGKDSAPAALAPEAFAAAIDRFLAAAATTSSEPAAEQWLTTRGPLSASPWLTPVAPAADAETRDDAAKLPRERAWLVEGDRKDVELLLQRAAAFGRARRLTVSQGEMPVPPEFVAPSASPDAGSLAMRRLAAGTAGVDVMRIVLRVRLRAR